MAQRQTEIILGIPVDKISLQTATELSVQAVAGKTPQIVFACANPHSLVTAQYDSRFRQALINANLVVPDGIGVMIMATVTGFPLGDRITGHDYFTSLLTTLEQSGRGRVFFFGSSEQVLDLIGKRFRREFPQLTLCGTYAPPFRSWSPDENAKMLQVINAAKPDVLWVGMTAPKQETWVEANRQNLQVPVIGSIGAVFDFYAETHPRSPRWLSRLGLEWAYRFIREPRRMWKRNIISAPQFVALVIKQQLMRIK